jgi:hypothetical protein
MNTHIFTEQEIKILTKWMTGKANREDTPHLHVTLNRLRANEKQLSYQVKFFVLALRRLHHGRLRHRGDDFETTLTIAPIILRASGLGSYTLGLPWLRDAQSDANDVTKDTQQRLDAAQEAIIIAKMMTKPDVPQEPGDDAEPTS